MELLENIIIQTAVLPLVVSVCVAFILRKTRVGGLALLVGFIAAYLTIMGMPAYPPKASMQKLGWVIVAIFTFAIVVNFVRTGPWRVYLGLVIAIIGSGWMAWPRLQGAEPLWLGVFAIVAVVTATITTQVHRWNIESLVAEGSILAIAVGIGCIALIGSSGSISQLSFALAAAMGGVMLLNWPARQFPAGAMTLSGVSILALLATILIFYTHVITWPMILLGFVPVVGRLGEGAALRRSFSKPVAGVITVGCCFLPSLIAAGFVYRLTPVSESLY